MIRMQSVKQTAVVGCDVPGIPGHHGRTLAVLLPLQLCFYQPQVDDCCSPVCVSCVCCSTDEAFQNAVMTSTTWVKYHQLPINFVIGFY